MERIKQALDKAREERAAYPSADGASDATARPEPSSGDGPIRYTQTRTFDLPPVLAADDALALSPYVDAALLVLEEGRSQKDEVTRAMELLRVTNVLNRSEEQMPAY
jgi:hypothetical protein